MTIEVALDQFDHARQAALLGADRIELCANLNEGGTTPAIGLITQCAQQLDIPIHVMVRCRPGNFVYSSEEINIMAIDIKAISRAGAHGIVFGALTSTNHFDMETTKQIVLLAKENNLKVTFHRAIDACRDLWHAMDQLIDLQVDNILTSGQSKRAINGLETIRRMIKHVNNKIDIMAGSGVNKNNALQLIESGVNAIHFTCRKQITDRTDPFKFGQPWMFDDDKMVDIKTQCHKHKLNEK